MAPMATAARPAQLRDVRPWTDAELAAVVDPASFSAWLPRVSPTMRWDWRHLRYLQDALDRVTQGEVTRLMVFMPPRHGKTEQASVRYPVYRMCLEPTTRVIVASYNDTQARKISRKARRVAASVLPLSTDRTAVEDWETVAGGGMRAVGVGAGITGQGGDLIVIDDPVKSREEAESLTYRDRVWEWYTDDLYTRLEPGGTVILIMTRWHEDDLAGRIRVSEDGANWTVVSLPALAEERDPLERAPGDALCPDRFDEAALESIRNVQRWSFDALYQQRPTGRKGELFDPAWFEIVPAAPALARRLRWWDRASTEGGGDATAGGLVAEAQGVFYVEDIDSFHHAPGERDRRIRQRAELDRQRLGTRKFSIWGEQEPGSGGKDAALAFVRLLAGFDVHTEPTTGDKVTGAEPMAAQAQAGNVKLVAGPWNAKFLEQARQFPRGAHDDVLECVFRAFNKLARRGPARAGDWPATAHGAR